MRKIFILVTFFIFSLIFCKNITFAADNLAEKLSGRILLQTEKNGEAWYVNPIDLKKYYLSRPEDAFALMRKLGIGIKNSDLEKIPNDKNFTNKNLFQLFFENLTELDLILDVIFLERRLFCKSIIKSYPLFLN